MKASLQLLHPCLYTGVGGGSITGLGNCMIDPDCVYRFSVNIYTQVQMLSVSLCQIMFYPSSFYHLLRLHWLVHCLVLPFMYAGQFNWPAALTVTALPPITEAKQLNRVLTNEHFFPSQLVFSHPWKRLMPLKEREDSYWH